MLTRDFLRNADCKTAFGSIDESMLLTSEQRAASLDCTLARRPDNSPVWIFGYGSLMWNPVFDSEEARPATLHGYHRAFCLRLTAGRGTHAQPGRMLALRDGGQTTGLAFRLPEDKLHEELSCCGSVKCSPAVTCPTWCELALDDGRIVTALVFIMDPSHPQYEADTRLSDHCAADRQGEWPVGHQRAVPVCP